MNTLNLEESLLPCKLPSTPCQLFCLIRLQNYVPSLGFLIPQWSAHFQTGSLHSTSTTQSETCPAIFEDISFYILHSTALEQQIFLLHKLSPIVWPHWAQACLLPGAWMEKDKGNWEQETCMQNHGASLEIAFVIKQTKNCQSRFDARYWMLGAGALGRPRGMVWGGRGEEGLGWGTHVHLWQIHFDIWQN